MPPNKVSAGPWAAGRLIFIISVVVRGGTRAAFITGRGWLVNKNSAHRPGPAGGGCGGPHIG
jgi:hypothetical protein